MYVNSPHLKLVIHNRGYVDHFKQLTNWRQI
jgi:hypothetical protein